MLAQPEKKADPLKNCLTLPVFLPAVYPAGFDKKFVHAVQNMYFVTFWDKINFENFNKSPKKQAKYIKQLFP